MLALGTGLEKGETDRPVAHVDVAVTAAAVHDLPPSEMEGGRIGDILA